MVGCLLLVSRDMRAQRNVVENLGFWNNKGRDVFRFLPISY